MHAVPSDLAPPVAADAAGWCARRRGRSPGPRGHVGLAQADRAGDLRLGRAHPDHRAAAVRQRAASGTRGSAPCSGSRRRCGTAASRTGCPGSRPPSMHSESSAQRIARRRIRRAGGAERERARVRVDADRAGSRRRSPARARPCRRGRRTANPRPTAGTGSDGSPTLSWPQKFSGHSPPPAASAGQMASGRGMSAALIDAAVLLVLLAARHVAATPGQRDGQQQQRHRERSSSSNHYAITCGNPEGFHALTRPRCHYNLSLLGSVMSAATRQPPSCSSGTRSCPARSRTRTPAS